MNTGQAAVLRPAVTLKVFATTSGLVAVITVVFTMMIILSPEQPKPEPIPLTRTPVVDRFDRMLVDLVSETGGEPVLLWPLIHQIVEGERPPGRAERQQFVSRLLCRVRALLRRGVIVRDDKAHVRIADPVKLVPTTVTVAPKQLKNLPPSPFATVGDWATFHTDGPRRRVFSV